ncbi:MAG: metalloregulator ArsR/SmtB family transcription factor [Deltaproteobacteria bacterium]|nr:metalloregulator ArsR/SmtB family transcription factor [Deltaproteobacteria bacterium]
MSKDIYELQANICQTLANAKRLEIIGILCDKEFTVGEVAEKMGIRTANLSQHLSIMKAKGILNSRRDGVHIYYSISNPKVVQACTLMKEVMAELLQAQGNLSKKVL